MVIFILILIFQSFLYINSGRYLHHLLHINLEEQENKRCLPITNLNHFLNPKKLSKNTLNISPSL